MNIGSDYPLQTRAVTLILRVELFVTYLESLCSYAAFLILLAVTHPLCLKEVVPSHCFNYVYVNTLPAA